MTVCGPYHRAANRVVFKPFPAFQVLERGGLDPFDTGKTSDAIEVRFDGVPIDGIAERPLLSALKLYLALRDDVDAEHAVLAAGINCLNESAFSDTTPCLAWDLLHRERGLMWGCEGDVVSMLAAAGARVHDCRRERVEAEDAFLALSSRVGGAAR